MSYVEELKASGHLIITHALKSIHTAATVRVRAGRLSTTDGPFAETKESLGGFFLIEANDLEEAVGIASKWPSARLAVSRCVRSNLSCGWRPIRQVGQCRFEMNSYD